MPRATWDALRAHIVRERQRKKNELEKSAEKEHWNCEKGRINDTFHNSHRGMPPLRLDPTNPSTQTT